MQFGSGGFDEHHSFRGYICGPYELAWRAINAGLPEEWHDPKVSLWHFAHPNEDYRNMYDRLRIGTLHELAFVRPHIKEHALRAVEAFSTGRLLPLEENSAVHERRMTARRIGSAYEAEYARQTKPSGFGGKEMLLFRWLHLENFVLRFLRARVPPLFKGYRRLADRWYSPGLKRRRFKVLGTADALYDDRGAAPKMTNEEGCAKGDGQ